MALITEMIHPDLTSTSGGVNADEDVLVALQRELEEETGAREVQVVRPYGHIEEYRPHWKPAYDLMHMTSHFYVCDIAPELQGAKMEGYEVDNGMRPLWVNLHEAIAHNQSVLKRKEKTMGLSIQRETFMLERVAGDLIAGDKLPA